MISAISNRGHLQFMLMEKGFNSEVFKTFLEQMIKYSKRKIFFITDNHPAHKTIKLNQWLEERKDKIEVFFIPPYSILPRAQSTGICQSRFKNQYHRKKQSHQQRATQTKYYGLYE